MRLWPQGGGDSGPLHVSASEAEMRWDALMMLPGGICYPAAMGWVSKCPVGCLAFCSGWSCRKDLPHISG